MRISSQTSDYILKKEKIPTKTSRLRTNRMGKIDGNHGSSATKSHGFEKVWFSWCCHGLNWMISFWAEEQKRYDTEVSRGK